MFAQPQGQQQPLKQIMHYEEQLNTVIQKIQNLILDNHPAAQNQFTQLLKQQNQLIKILEVESTRLSPQSRQIYNRNLTRFKKKNKQHKEYVHMQFGNNAIPANNEHFEQIMRYEKQNMQLAGDKFLMYENQRTQNKMGEQLQYQGEQLRGGIDQNREIREETSRSENTINLIELAILRRKFMFGSLIVFFIIALVIVIIVKANKTQ